MPDRYRGRVGLYAGGTQQPAGESRVIVYTPDAGQPLMLTWSGIEVGAVRVTGWA